MEIARNENRKKMEIGKKEIGKNLTLKKMLFAENGNWKNCKNTK